jgi:hypothetical protein
VEAEGVKLGVDQRAGDGAPLRDHRRQKKENRGAHAEGDQLRRSPARFGPRHPVRHAVKRSHIRRG